MKKNNTTNLEIINHIVGSIGVSFAAFAQNKNITAINNEEALPAESFFEFSAFVIHLLSRTSFDSAGETFQDYVYSSVRKHFIESNSEIWSKHTNHSHLKKYPKTAIGLNKFLDEREVEYSSFEIYLDLQLQGLINTLSPVKKITPYDSATQELYAITENFNVLVESIDIENVIKLINIDNNSAEELIEEDSKSRTDSPETDSMKEVFEDKVVIQAEKKGKKGSRALFFILIVTGLIILFSIFNLGLNPLLLLNKATSYTKTDSVTKLICDVDRLEGVSELEAENFGVKNGDVRWTENDFLMEIQFDNNKMYFKNLSNSAEMVLYRDRALESEIAENSGIFHNQYHSFALKNKNKEFVYLVDKPNYSVNYLGHCQTIEKDKLTQEGAALNDSYGVALFINPYRSIHVSPNRSVHGYKGGYIPECNCDEIDCIEASVENNSDGSYNELKMTRRIEGVLASKNAIHPARGSFISPVLVLNKEKCIYGNFYNVVNGERERLERGIMTHIQLSLDEQEMTYYRKNKGNEVVVTGYFSRSNNANHTTHPFFFIVDDIRKSE